MTIFKNKKRVIQFAGGTVFLIAAVFGILYFGNFFSMAEMPNQAQAPAGQDCIITGDSIPANCEGENVTINPNQEVYANKIAVWQENNITYEKCILRGDLRGTDKIIGNCSSSRIRVQRQSVTGEECNLSNQEKCDSKRHFKSLTITDSALLTHDGLTTDDLDTNNPKESIAGQTTGDARWKKVDLEIEGDVFLKDGGRIDVTGRGYPGGQTDQNENTHSSEENGFGPGGGQGITSKKEQGDPYYGAGGGFGGKGADGNEGIIGGESYPDLLWDEEIVFDFGSGGGDAENKHYHSFPKNQHDWSFSDGGNGGGRIRLIVNGTIKATNWSYSIIANGSDQTVVDTDNESKSLGGGGAGGSIYLKASNYGGGLNSPFGADGPNIDVSGGYDNSNTLAFGGDGVVRVYSDSPDIKWKNLSAHAGNGGGGGGGGRITIGITQAQKLESQGRKITAQVTWLERGKEESINLSTLLKNVQQINIPPGQLFPYNTGSSFRLYMSGYNLKIYKKFDGDTSLHGYSTGIESFSSYIFEDYLYGCSDGGTLYKYGLSDLSKVSDFAIGEVCARNGSRSNIGVTANYIFGDREKNICRLENKNNGIREGCKDDWSDLPNYNLVQFNGFNITARAYDYATDRIYATILYRKAWRIGGGGDNGGALVRIHPRTFKIEKSVYNSKSKDLIAQGITADNDSRGSIYLANSDEGWISKIKKDSLDLNSRISKTNNAWKGRFGGFATDGQKLYYGEDGKAKLFMINPLNLNIEKEFRINSPGHFVIQP